MNNLGNELELMIESLIDGRFDPAVFCTKFFRIRSYYLDHPEEVNEKTNYYLNEMFWPAEDYEPIKEIRDSDEYYIDEVELIKRIKEVFHNSPFRPAQKDKGP